MHEVQAGPGTRFSISIPAGDLEVQLRDGLASGSWRFRTLAPSRLVVDFQAPGLCSVPGVEPLESQLPEGFIPTPRLRFDVNGRVYDVVSSDAGVLDRHYSRPRHQELTYHRPDPWTQGFHFARIRQLRRLLRGVNGRVCDVGSGFSLVAMAGPWDFQLAACDRDAEAIAALQTQGIDAVVGPADRPPFAPGSFDAVYAGEIIEHVVEPLPTLRRWVELLRPGGRLIVTTPNRRHWLARARGYEVVENPEHLFEWDVGELRRAVRRAGAEIESMEGLLLPIPVYLPRRGWRDLGLGVVRRVPVPHPVVVRYMGLARRLPRLAFDLAVVARRVR